MKRHNNLIPKGNSLGILVLNSETDNSKKSINKEKILKYSQQFPMVILQADIKQRSMDNKMRKVNSKVCAISQ